MSNANGDGPGYYWTAETTGRLVPAIARYLENEPLSSSDIEALRAYIRQWIFSPVWDGSPYADNVERQDIQGLRDLVDSLTSREQIRRALRMGIDPW